MTYLAWTWRLPGIEAGLIVSHEAANVFINNRQRPGENERGGQLFVNPLDPYGLVLTLATPPHIADRAGKTWLELDAERCKKEINEAGSRGLRLAGYWHTHPQPVPKISPTDVHSFRKFANSYSELLPHPIAIIVGYSQNRQSIKAWSFRSEEHIEAIRMDP